MIKNPFNESSRQKDCFFIAVLGFITYFFIFIKPPYFSVSDAPFWINTARFSLHRPVTLFILKLVNPVFKLNPLGYYSFGIALHLCNAILLYKLIVSLAKDNKIAFTTAAFFLVHYINADTVLGIYQFETILSGFFYLISLVSFTKSLFLIKFKKIFYALSLISFLIALGSRESVFSLPFIILTVDILFVKKDNSNTFKRAVCRYSPYFILAVTFVIFVALSQWYTYRIPERLNVVYHNFSGVIINYAILMEALFIPFNFQNATNAFWQMANHQFGSALLIVVGFCLLTFYAKSKLYKFSLIWIALTSIPFLARPYQLKEVYLYLPLIGAGLFFPF